MVVSPKKLEQLNRLTAEITGHPVAKSIGELCAELAPAAVAQLKLLATSCPAVDVRLSATKLILELADGTSASCAMNGLPAQSTSKRSSASTVPSSSLMR